MSNWKPAFTFRGQKEPSTNAQVFATEAEALASAEARFMVWTMPEGFLAVETDDPVNYARIDDHDVSLATQSAHTAVPVTV